MTSQEFLFKNIGRPGYRRDGRERYCASVMVDGNGTAYSYWYHYPLAVIINGKGFVNNRGYSATTSKHISWARHALAQRLGWDNVYSVPLERGQRSFDLPSIKAAANQEYNRLMVEMAGKKRKNTKVYEWLLHDAARMVDVLQAVAELEAV